MAAFRIRIGSVAWLIMSVALVGCSRETPAPAKVTPKASPTSMPSVAAGQAPSTEVAPPPSTGSAGTAPQAAPAQAATGDGTIGAPIDLSELERLNWALGMYHIAHIESPPLANFEPLVKARLIKEVPKAPPGKKYVLDGPKWEVRLENAK